MKCYLMWCCFWMLIEAWNDEYVIHYQLVCRDEVPSIMTAVKSLPWSPPSSDCVAESKLKLSRQALHIIITQFPRTADPCHAIAS
jgi:hypothetical protein